MFHVGQLVVCVDDTRYPGEPGPYVVRGHIYTIETVFEEWAYPPSAPDGAWISLVTLSEVPIVKHPDWAAGFEARCFRPLDETRLSIFRKMLAPAPRKEEVA